MILFNKKDNLHENTSKKRFKKKKGIGKCISIDLGNKEIKLVVGEHTEKKIDITSMYNISQDENIYYSGQIYDERVVGNNITKIIKDNKIKESNVILNIEASDLIKREMVIPVLGKEDAIKAITLEIGEYLPIDIEKYIIQYVEIDRFEEDSLKKMNILVYALPYKLAEQYYTLLKNIGLNPSVLDIQSNCIEKLFSNFKINGVNTNNETIAVIDIGNSGMNISIIEKGKHRFNRVVRGSQSIKTALIMTGNCTENNIDYIINKYMSRNIFSESIDEEDLKIKEEILFVVNSWISDMEKLFQYYTSRNTENKIDTVFIYGGGTMLRNIGDYIESRIGISTRVISSIENLDVSKISNNIDIIKYINCISALIGR